MVALAERVQVASLRRFVLSRWGVVTLLMGLAGIGLRIYTLRSAVSIPNSDEAIVGLMVRHALHGELAVFFWDRSYGGTQEVLLAVPIFAVTGSSWLALRMVPILLSAVAALLVWRVGRRTIGEKPALVAAGLFWIWPPFNFLQLTREQGFYASNVVYCAGLLLLALRAVERPDRFRIGLFGFVLGLSYWQSSQVIPIAVVAIAWMIWKQPRCLRQAWVAVPLAVIGALPWLVWNIRHGWVSTSSQHPGFSTYLHSLRLLASPLLPMTLGLRAPYSDALFVPSTAATDLIYACLIALFLYGVVRSRHRNVSLLFAVALVFPFLYALPSKTSYIEGWPQYTTVITPVIALLVAQLATRYWRSVAILVVAGLMSAVALHRMDVYVRTDSQPLPTAPRSFSPLISTLDRLGLDRVYADYWIAYRLDFDSQERIIAVENEFASLSFQGGQATPPPDPYVRYRPYERKVQAARHGFVFWQQTYRSLAIIPQLTRHGYRPHFVGPWVVYAPPG